MRPVATRPLPSPPRRCVPARVDSWPSTGTTVTVPFWSISALPVPFSGLTLHSSPGEIYRALVEATAFGARRIIEQIESYGQTIDEVVNCGGISIKNTLVMQIYADVLNRPMKISRSTQTPALGSAIAAAVVAGGERGGYDDFDSAMNAMTGTMERVFEPIPAHVAVYERLYRLYRSIHDAFGVEGEAVSLFHVMKELLDIRNKERQS